jgi:hypothetical protein
MKKFGKNGQKFSGRKFDKKIHLCLTLQPVLIFAGEHCHPSFYSTGHGAYLSGRSAAQYFMAVASAARAKEEEEEVYNLVRIQFLKFNSLDLQV